MELLMFTIYDQKAHAHLPPFVLPRKEQAVRTFSDCINSSDHQFSKHPEDYTLLHIATFDDDSGACIPLEVPIVVGTGIQFVEIQTDSKQDIP